MNLSMIGAILFNLTVLPAIYGAFTAGQGLPALALANLILAMAIMAVDAYRKSDIKTAAAHGFGCLANIAILIRLYM